MTTHPQPQRERPKAGIFDEPGRGVWKPFGALYHGGGGGLAIATAPILCLVTIAASGRAQEMISVPPPPPVPATQAPLAPSAPQETIFQAPDAQRASPGRYVVFVNGDSPYLLQQVQTVEPKAFVQQHQGRSVIQAGAYSDEANARRQVEALRGQGVMAEVSYSSAVSSPTASQGSSYLVIVPGRQAELPTLAQQAMKLGVRQESVQMKNAPLGWHLAIGPFGDYQEAKEVNQYLQRGGLDSRVYFNR